VALAARQANLPVPADTVGYLAENLFATITNANFDRGVILGRVKATVVDGLVKTFGVAGIGTVDDDLRVLIG